MKKRSELDAFFHDIYEKLLELFPEFATRAGDHRYDDRLSDPGPEGIELYKSTIRESLRRLLQIDPRPLGPPQRTSYELARFWFEGEAAGFEFDHDLMLLDPLQGFQISLPNLINDMPFETAEDYGRAIARIAGLPRYVDRFLQTTAEALRRGILQARHAAGKVLAQVDYQLGLPPEGQPLFRPFLQFPALLNGSQQAEIRSRALRAVEGEALPALRRFREHLREEYIPRAREEAGIWALPRGEEIYEILARQSTTTRLSPDEIHRTGLSEVGRIRAEMEKAKADAGFPGGLEEFFRFLRTDRRFYFERAEDLLTGYRDISKRADAELPRFFGRLPRIPCGVLPIPDYAAASSTSAYYQPPPADGSRPGIFYANVHDPGSRPRFEMEALTLHEAVPGHHLQVALQIELEGLPEFRTRWLSFTAFVEGWGLYAERLGKEMGFYGDPYSEFGRLTYEVWRACRLVVDTGIHRFRWTRDRAIEYLSSNSSLSHLNIENEVDRYIAWPAQALAYKIGELKIREIRRRAEEALGERFDLRAFHDRLLEEGSLPLEILERKMDAWIHDWKGARRREGPAVPGPIEEA